MLWSRGHVRLRRIGIVSYFGLATFSLITALGGGPGLELNGTIDPPGPGAVIGLSDPDGRLVATTHTDFQGHFRFRDVSENTYTVFVLARTRRPPTAFATGPMMGPGRAGRGSRGTIPLPGTGAPPRTRTPRREPEVRITGEGRRTARVAQSLADAKGRISVVVPLISATQTALQETNTVSVDRVGVRRKPIPATAVQEFAGAWDRLLADDFKRAIRHLQRATEIAPWFVSAWNLAGVVAYHSEHYQEAESYFRSALAEDPDAVDAYAPLVNLGGVLNKQGKYRDALEYNQRAHSRRTDDVQAILQLSITHFYLQDYDQALVDIGKAKRLEPDWMPQRMLAEIYLQHGDRQAAIRELEEYLEFDPDGPAAGSVRRKLEDLKRN